MRGRAGAHLAAGAVRARRLRDAGAGGAARGDAAGAWLITSGATWASGNSNRVDPVQTVEWLMADISCVLTRRGVEPTAGEWAALVRIAARHDWPQPRACVVMNPMMHTASFNPIAVVDHYRGLVGVWLSLGARYPAEMAAAHASRVRLFLPPLVTGPPEIVSFLHSTILPNDFGLAWTFPALAERARAMVRAWNAMGYVLANAAVWLIVLIVAAWRLPEHRAALTPAIVIAVALDLGLIAAAPISEGRYGLFILICGQTTAVFSLMRRLS